MHKADKASNCIAMCITKDNKAKNEELTTEQWNI